MLWILYFCYATSAALVLQKAILPLLPSVHAGFGLLDGDSRYFHTVALELAARIREIGWSEWAIYPSSAAAGNVAILGGLYALFGDDPSLIVPVNAALHASSGVLLFLIARQVVPGAAGRLGGMAAGTLFVLLPSALNWYGQLHKDGYAIAGILLIVWAWLRLQGRRTCFRDFWLTAAASAGAVLLIAFVRPYNLILLAAVMSVAFCVVFFFHIARLREHAGAITACAMSLSLIAAGAVITKRASVDERYALDSDVPVDVGDWRWHEDARLPDFVEDFLEAAARTRVRFIVSGIEASAGSMIDVDRRPARTTEVAAYLPRALQIALFAPFPDRWLEKKSLPHVVAMLETLAWYLIAPGVLFCLLHAQPARSVLVLVVALLFLTIYGLTMPNVGTLYRVRTPYLFLLVTMGTVGWLQLFLRHLPSRLARTHDEKPPGGAAGAANALRSAEHGAILGASGVVAALTAFTFVGFFLRDAVLARWFGTGPEINAWFVAVAVPSFVVAALSVPLGGVVSARFLEARQRGSERERAAQALVSRISALYAAGMLPLVALLAMGASALLGVVGSELAPESAALARTLFFWMLPIVALSGFVVIGNGILNALGAYALGAAAQLVVPAVSIAAIVLAGRSNGVLGAVCGMAAGQALNLWIVVRALRWRGVSLLPRWGTREPLPDFAAQYFALVSAALLTNLSAPVNLAMASTLDSGAATLGLGSKMTTFVTGIVAATMTAVILPRFAAIIARHRLVGLREEFTVLLLAATALGTPIAVLLFAGSELAVRMAFASGVFGEESVEAVAMVMRFSIVQLPFLTASLLIVKFAVAARAAGWVFVASLLALGLNVALNLVLMRMVGVAGIALANTAAVALSTFAVLLLFRRLGHVSGMDVLMLTLNWMTYATFLVCLHYRSYAGVVAALLAMLVLLAGHLNTLFGGRRAVRG